MRTSPAAQGLGEALVTEELNSARLREGRVEVMTGT
jgi:hypothetical protein